MENKAQAIVDAAHERVRQLLTETDMQVKTLKEAASASGRKQGFDEASLLLQKLEVLRETMNDEVILDITSAAFEVARGMLDAEVSAFPDSIVRIALEVLKATPDAQHVYFRVNPADAEVLKECKDRLINSLDRAKDVDIRADKQVARGGLLIQTEHGVIDAQLSTQLEVLSHASMENG